MPISYKNPRVIVKEVEPKGLYTPAPYVPPPPSVATIGVGGLRPLVELRIMTSKDGGKTWNIIGGEIESIEVSTLQSIPKAVWTDIRKIDMVQRLKVELTVRCPDYETKTFSKELSK
jgi:hypothetical protein